MRLEGVLLAATLVAALFTGCVALGAQAELMTAKQADGIAGPEARTWSPNATLALAGAGEDANLTIEATNTTFEDDDIGDGRSFAWRLVYTAPEHEDKAYVVIVLGNGTIHRQTEVATRQEVGGYGASVSWEERFWPVRNWTLDSHQALSVASMNRTWQALAPDATEAGAALLGAPKGHDPVWIASLEAPRGNRTEEVHVFINATTARVLDRAPGWLADRFQSDVSTGDWGAQDWEDLGERGSYQGTLTLTQATQTHEITLQRADHQRLTLDLRANPPAPGATVAATLRTPDGQRHHANVTGASMGVELFDLDEPAAGSYTLELTLTQGAVYRYEGCWYTEGASWGGFGGPCQGFGAPAPQGADGGALQARLGALGS